MVDPLVATVSAHLASHSEAIATGLLARVVADIPTMGRDDEELARFALAMAKSTLEEFAAMLEHAIPIDEIETPWLATKYVRRLAWEGITVDQVIRGYRLAHEWLFERVAAFVATQESSRADLAGFYSDFGNASFRYIDALSTRIATAFEAEREAMLRGELARRGGVIRDLLDGRRVDTQAAERTLGYRLHGPHLALLVWPADTTATPDASALDDAVTAIAEVTGATGRLLLHEAPDLLAAWLTVPGGVATATPTLQADDVVVAAGRVLPGIDGFRASRRQAERARKVARAGRRGLVRYEDVALAALLVDDPNAARAFASEELGPLAADGETEATLRETLLVLLRSAGPLEAAETLFVHRNTVIQRQRKAEELLGRPVRERREEIAAALQICAVLGP
ncbi:MAG: hypothetical protein QOI65_763 [Thermoleophilaceae bacterium]|nr:hypothetical protein [Thermoleophilaceae bacterium]